jgi:hypothetical protein
LDNGAFEYMGCFLKSGFWSYAWFGEMAWENGYLLLIFVKSYKSTVDKYRTQSN